jgi:hypothetical protein
MAVKGYVNEGKYFCIEHFRPNTGDMPIEDAPEDATCNNCSRPLNEVAMEHDRQ